MTYNPNIHHRRSIRLKGYDYAQAGLYFITVCAHERAHLFGDIMPAADNIPAQMVWSDGGKVANECWLKIPEHFPDAVLHEHIVMPNHVHGIIELEAKNISPVQENISPSSILPAFKSPSKTIGSIIRGFKIGVTKWYRSHTEITTVWQRNYYEHIIRNEQSYQNISDYISNNPAKWAEDKFYN